MTNTSEKYGRTKQGNLLDSDQLLSKQYISLPLPVASLMCLEPMLSKKCSTVGVWISFYMSQILSESKISKSGRFRIFSRALESASFFLTLRNGTSGSRNENLWTLFNQIYLQLMWKMASEINFAHSKVGYSPAYGKKCLFSKSSNGPILKFWILRVLCDM